MKTKKIIIKTNKKLYTIYIGKNIIDKLSSLLKKNLIEFKKCLVVIDKNVPKKMVSKINKSLKNKKISYFYFDASEKNKNKININKILEILLNKNFSREDCLIAVGGGITGDVGGFAASLFKRGLKFINIPTTLLAQVDSSIGGKQVLTQIMEKILLVAFTNQD